MTLKHPQRILWLLILTVLLILPWMGYHSALTTSWSQLKIIIWQLRLPRLLMALMVGATLATMGLITQTLFNNPLAGLELFGITSGASLGASIALLVNPFLPLAPFALAGSLVMASILFTLVKHYMMGLRLILAGLALNSLASGLLAILISFSPQPSLSRYLFWSLGGFHFIRWEQLIPITSLFIPFIWFCSRQGSALQLLLFGDDCALSLGLNVPRYRRGWLMLLIIAHALIVSMVGPIGFVGLMSAHIARLLVGHHPKNLLTITPLIGALLLAISDTLGRTLFAPYELSAGIILAVVGAIYFLIILGTHHHE
jgi:ABC-type Fe3+-siderophore transport system permease subunit